MYDAVFTVPGTFEFSDRDDASHLVIVWALSQTEVAGDAKHGLRRLVDMPRFMSIVTEHEDRKSASVQSSFFSLELVDTKSGRRT
jgi:hypothetical protein